MTQYGNAWMMRRYYWTTRAIRIGLIDDDEYFGCHRAVEYFEKAGKLAQNERFAALSFTMAGIAKDHTLAREINEKYDELSYKKKGLEASPPSAQEEFPDHGLTVHRL